jgi:peptidoglycan/LPS O-acetylase OafA/YrhL
VAVILSARHQGPLNRWLGSGPLVWLGSISFALYITHDLVLTRTIGAYRLLISQPNFVTDLALVIGGLALSAAFAWGAHALFEQNAIAAVLRWRPKLLRRILTVGAGTLWSAGACSRFMRRGEVRLAKAVASHRTPYSEIGKLTRSRPER